MKKFTKSLMTLALCCFAGGVNAQTWEEVQASGWVHEWAQDVAEQTAQIDAAKDPDGDGVYSIYCRSSQQAEEAGNPTKDGNGNFASWDSQFFITFGSQNALAEGDKLRLTMSVKADAAITGIETQSHANPGGYIHWFAIDNVDFTTDWVEITREYEAADKDANGFPWGKLAVGTYTVAFNLAKGDANTFYFKDIKVEILKAPEVEVQWVDLLRDYNGDLEGDDNRCFFTKQPAFGCALYPATITDGIGSNGGRAIKLVSRDIIQNGTDDNGNPTYTQPDWDCQFFIRLPQSLPAGTKFRGSLDYKANKAGRVDTQSHCEPSDYIHYVAIGSLEFTDEWQTYEFKGTVSSDMSKADKPMYSIAFNLSCNHEATEFIFDNIVFEIPEDAVTDEDFGNVVYGYEPQYPTNACFKIADGMSTYGVDIFDESIGTLALAGTDLIAYAAEFRGDYISLTPVEVLKPGEGYIFESDGEAVCDLSFGGEEADEEIVNDLSVSDGTVVGDGTIFVLADGDNGTGFYKLAEGAVVPAGKAYMQIVENAREFIGFGSATAIKNVKSVNEDNVIYNLAGQRVNKATKGLYIVNGKKIVK